MNIRLLLAGLAVAALVGPAMAQDKTVNLKLSHWVPATHPLQKAMEEWGASVEKASGGTLKYSVFPAQQLGKAQDHYDMTRDGIVDLSYINPGFQPGRFPIVSAGEHEHWVSHPAKTFFRIYPPVTLSGEVANDVRSVSSEPPGSTKIVL